MPDLFLLLLGFVFTVSSIFYLALGQRQRDVVLGRLHFRRRRATGALTPPRSLSPSKKEKIPAAVSTIDFRELYPPSRRFTLTEVDFKVRPVLEASANYEEAVDDRPCVPLDECVDEEERSKFFTPTAFSLEEVVALGDFPDYAGLSGVPLPAACPEFDINKALPRPYRPFRWSYHQTMSLMKMDPDYWLELENTYVKRIRQREELFAKHGEAVLQSLPGSEMACKELMEMCLQFLCAWYPHYFRLDTEKMMFYNRILNTETHIKSMPPLHVILQNIPEDFGIMLRDPETGLYCFRAGLICSSLGWNVGTKIGMKLHEIHQPIPDYKEKMQYFAKKPTDKPIQRGSWGLEIDEPLFMPPGDPHEKLRDVQDPEYDISRCNLRVDWQTLRRLPLSAAVIFNFKALFTPVENFRNEPYIPSLCLKVLREGKKNLMEYKNTWHTEHCVIPALEAYEQEQVAKGLIPKDWDVHTLDDAPFYPGWEEMWHEAQGF
ncbi:hypothetical protein BJ546DRAFT_1057604 [Cryomyces antarcticus]